MANRKVYHVLPKGNGDWEVKQVGAQRASANCENKSDAINRAKEIAKNQPLSQVVIHKQDGKIQTEYTYGKDPNPPRG